MSYAYIGLGSNLGVPLANCLKAIKQLQQSGVALICRSPFYRTAPVGYLQQPYFINAVLKVKTSLSAEELFIRMRNIEQKLGKKISFNNGPRTIDMDLLLYNNEIINTPQLVLPHPAMAERGFVLIPLADIAPELKHPILGLTTKELLAKLKKRGECIRIEEQKNEHS